VHKDVLIFEEIFQNPIHGQCSVHATYMNIMFLQATWPAANNDV